MLTEYTDGQDVGEFNVVALNGELGLSLVESVTKDFVVPFNDPCFGVFGPCNKLELAP